MLLPSLLLHTPPAASATLRPVNLRAGGSDGRGEGGAVRGETQRWRSWPPAACRERPGSDATCRLVRFLWSRSAPSPRNTNYHHHEERGTPRHTRPRPRPPPPPSVALAQGRPSNTSREKNRRRREYDGVAARHDRRHLRRSGGRQVAHAPPHSLRRRKKPRGYGRRATTATHKVREQHRHRGQVGAPTGRPQHHNPSLKI